MPGGGSMLPYGNGKGEWVLTVTLSPSSVAGSSTSEQTFTVTGLAMGDFVELNKPSHQVGLGITNTRVSAVNTLAVTFMNTSNNVVTPTAAELYTLCVTRPDNVNQAGNSTVVNLV